MSRVIGDASGRDESGDLRSAVGDSSLDNITIINKSTQQIIVFTAGRSVNMPPLNAFKLPMLYGTAWKADGTANLVYQALQAGFRGIDTAAQPRHYQGVRKLSSRPKKKKHP